MHPKLVMLKLPVNGSRSLKYAALARTNGMDCIYDATVIEAFAQQDDP